MIMKKVLSVIALAASLTAVSCHKEPKADPVPAITGEWHISSVSTKGVDYANQTIDIYISFSAEGTFELYQMIGQGRYRKFTGSWEQNEGVLSGKYSSGKAWGSSYEVSVSGETLTLTSTVSGEADTYVKAVIPESVKTEAYET